MKMKQFLIIVFSLIIISTNAQIKVFPGGFVAYGSTTAPAYGEKHHFSGDMVISASPVFPPVGSSAYIRGRDNYSTPLLPDYTWLGNNITGVFHPNFNEMGFTIGGIERQRFNSTGRSFFSTSPNVAQPFLDGTITAANIYLNERIISGTHTAGVAWTQAVNMNLTLPLSVGYRCIAPSQLGWYVTGVGWQFSTGNWVGSDAAIKTNVSTITNALSTVKKLRGIKYNTFGELSNPSLYGGVVSQYYGFIAQETQTAIPGNGVVKTGETGTIKYISYDQIIPFVVEAMKEVSGQLDSLKHVTDSLQKQITDCCSKSNNGHHNGQGRLMTPGDSNSSEGGSYIKQNSPNPFNKETVIEYFISEKNAVSSILVFDMNGKLLKTFKNEGNGKGALVINGNDFQPGMYYYSLIINNKEIGTKKMILTQ